MKPIINVANLTKQYGGFLLDGVGFSVPYGYIMGLIGPNGAGKSTIIKLLMNLIKRDGGSVEIFGDDILNREVAIKQRVGFVPDEPRFFEDVTLRDMKAVFSRFYQKWDDRLFHELADEFQLPLKKRAKTLSAGMRTKFACALAFSHHPDLLILDEPTSGLDPVFRSTLLERLSAFIQEGDKTVLLSTHITSDLESIADYVTFIHQGSIVFSSTLEEIRESWAVVKGEEAILSAEGVELLTGMSVGSYGAEAITSDVKRLGRAVLDNCVVERASLEDIMYFVKKEGDNDQSYTV